MFGPSERHRGIALVREPGPRLAEGIVTHIERTPVDVDLARAQHQAYVSTLHNAGWRPVTVEPADDCPDAVFIEDTVVVCDGLAVVTRPGARQRWPETAAVEAAARNLGLEIRRIDEGTLDGGDVLQIGQTVYVGQGGRTNADGIAQLAAILNPLGRTTVSVPLDKVLHLKSAVTALPDGTVLYHDMAGPFPMRTQVPEESGAHVVPLGDDLVLIAASAPRTAAMLEAQGWRPVVVDISEYERLEGCVTCLSVLVPNDGLMQ